MAGALIAAGARATYSTEDGVSALSLADSCERGLHMLGILEAAAEAEARHAPPPRAGKLRAMSSVAEVAEEFQMEHPDGPMPTSSGLAELATPTKQQQEQQVKNVDL